MTFENRDRAIDLARGFAILLMIYANMAITLVQPHGFAFKLISTLAAPLFAVLAGMMVMKTAAAKNWHQIILRSLLLLACGAFVDIAAWNLIPFVSIDILYLIGIGTLLVYALRNVKSSVIWLLVIASPFVALLLQHYFGYTDYPTELSITSGERMVESKVPTSIAHHYFIDGWFPLFPWLGFMLFGALLARLRWQDGISFPASRQIFINLLVLVAGAVAWIAYPGAMYVRAGFSELYYPPMPGFFIATLAAVFLTIALMDLLRNVKQLEPLALFGKTSLFVYIVHHLVIGRVFLPMGFDNNLEAVPFALYSSLLTAAMFVAAVLWTGYAKPLLRRLR